MAWEVGQYDAEQVWGLLPQKLAIRAAILAANKQPEEGDKFPQGCTHQVHDVTCPWWHRQEEMRQRAEERELRQRQNGELCP